MSSLTLRKATREKTKIRVALVGPSGSGKTYSALLLASGMANWDKIALIDTENGSGDLYSDLGPYNVITLQPPFTPERYMEAIAACETGGMEVIIIDSMTHEWDGKGGLLQVHDAMPGNSWTNWSKVTPRHDAFIERIKQSGSHVVATFRSKQDYVLQDKNGKQVPEKVGMKAITREGVDYEFTLVFDLNINHQATASKDRTKLFMDPAHDVIIPEKIGRETGQRILAWTLLGGDPQAIEPGKNPASKPQASSAAQQSRILELCKELGMEVQKDICGPSGVPWPLTAPFAEATIKRLEQIKANGETPVKRGKPVTTKTWTMPTPATATNEEAAAYADEEQKALKAA